MNRREALTALMALPSATVMTKTAIHPNDLIVISAPGHLSVEQAERIKEAFETNFKDLQVRGVVVLSEGMTLSVVRETPGS
jgi:hypothetical protein